MKKLAFLLIALITALGTLSFFAPVPAKAAFNANNLMADGIFDNSSTMSALDIDNFLNGFASSCISGNSGFRTADPLGWNSNTNSYAFGASVTAGKAIYDAATNYHLNPQVILATLQKEQSLVTGAAGCHPNTPDPASATPMTNQCGSGTRNCTSACPYSGGCMTIAMGYGCPSYCDSKYEGFSNQIIWATWILRFAQERSQGIYGYSGQDPGDENITYSGPTPAGCIQKVSGGSTSCSDGAYTLADSTNVSISTGATASLYRYTPFISGNKSFDNIFQSWFGSTIINLVRSPDSGVYLVENGVKRAFPSELIFLSYSYSWADVGTISDDALSAIPDGAPMKHFRESQLIRAATGGVYFVENATKRAFPSELIFLSNSYQWSNVKIISDAELAAIPDGSIMTYQRNGQLVSAAGGGVYLIDNATKRAFPSQLIFLSNSYNWANVITIDPYEISITPDGAVMTYNSGYREGNLVSSSSGGGVYLVDNGLKRPIASQLAFLSYSYKWSYVQLVSPTELSLIPDGAVMPYNVHFRDGQLVKSSSSGGIYLIQNGLKRPFPSVTIFLNDSYKWPDVVTISSAEVSLIPDGTPMN